VENYECYAVTMRRRVQSSALNLSRGSNSCCRNRVKLLINNKYFCTFHGKKYKNDNTSVELIIQNSSFNFGITKPTVNKVNKYETPPEDGTCYFEFLPNEIVVKILNYLNKNGWD